MDDETREVRFQKLADYMQAQWIKWFMAHGGLTSQRQFASHLGVSATQLGKYLKGQASYERSNDIANKLGIGIYTACDYPPRLPTDPVLIDIVEAWPDLSKSERKSLMEDAKLMVERKKKPLSTVTTG